MLMKCLDASYVALQNVLSNQSTLVSNLDDIKRQLARAYHDQFDSSSKKKAANPPNPEDILDIGRIMSMRDAAQEYITSTSRALKELAQRIESRDTPQPRPRSQREPQRPAMPEYPAPSSPAHARRYPFEEEKPDMPPRPAPQRPARQQQQPPPAPPPQPQEPKSSPPPLPLHPSSPTDNPSAPNPVACASVAGTPGNYCTGALRLQHDPTLTIRDILRIPTSSPSADPAAPLICKYCNLQLGDPSFRDAVFQGQGRGTAMAKQHMLACASLWDRRAMFKCMVCTAENMDSEFSGMEDFKAHLKAH
jgi:hypothetical protein